MDTKLSTLKGYLVALHNLPELKQLSVLRQHYSEMYQAIADVGANKALLPKLSQWPLNTVFRIVREASKNPTLTSLSPGFSLNQLIDELQPTVIVLDEEMLAEKDHNLEDQNMDEPAAPAAQMSRLDQAALEQARRNERLREEAEAQKQKPEGKPARKNTGCNEEGEGKVVEGGKRKTQGQPTCVGDDGVERHGKPATGAEESNGEPDVPAVPTGRSDKSRGKGKATTEELEKQMQEAKARVIRPPLRSEDEEDKDFADQLAKIRNLQCRACGEGTSKQVASSESGEDRMEEVVEQAEENIDDKEEDNKEEEEQKQQGDEDDDEAAEERASTEAEEQPSDKEGPAAAGVTLGSVVIPTGAHIAPPPADGTVKGWVDKIASLEVHIPPCTRCRNNGNTCYKKWIDGPVQGMCHYCSHCHISCNLSIKRISKSSKEPKEAKAPKGSKPREKKPAAAGKDKSKKSRSAAMKDLAAQGGSLVESLHTTHVVRKDLEQATDRNFMEIARAYEELRMAHNELQGHVLALGHTDQFLFNKSMGMRSHLPMEWWGADPKVKPTQLNLRDSAGEPIHHRLANPILGFAKYSLSPQGTVINHDGPWPEQYGTGFLPARTGEMFAVQRLNPKCPATATPEQIAHPQVQSALNSAGHRVSQNIAAPPTGPPVAAPPTHPSVAAPCTRSPAPCQGFPVEPMMPTPLQSIKNPQLAPSISTELGSKKGPRAQSSTRKETVTTDADTATDKSEPMDVDQPPSVLVDRTRARKRAAQAAATGPKKGRGRSRGGA
ncbi:hypothetical protein BJ165DRAFT_1616712 [Panaeolus papilionaceus]|nr:hypothetical protein BJ165DRAFT_1616712 [Panaeolus papilionaceus]